MKSIRHDYVTDCIWLFVTYMLILCRLLTSLFVRLHFEYFDYMHWSCSLITRTNQLCSNTCDYVYFLLVWHCLCILSISCSNVYNGVMVVVMHEVITCIVHMALH